MSHLFGKKAKPGVILGDWAAITGLKSQDCYLFRAVFSESTNPTLRVLRRLKGTINGLAYLL